MFLPVQIDLFSRFKCTRNVKHCRGLLIDGDHVIKWCENSSRLSISVGGPCLFESPSFTPYFLGHVCLYLSVAWQQVVNRGRRPAIHTAADDLESFLWLLVWVIAHVLKG
jgi:hypothetical protein